MRVAYLDTSALVAVLFGEPEAKRVRPVFEKVETFVSSNLLEAELLSAAQREGVALDELGPALSRIRWLIPDRPLHGEMREVLAAGPVRGADLWHLACALYLAPNPHELLFLTLDKAQSKVAAALGFAAAP